jgi:hypothetical protein
MSYHKKKYIKYKSLNKKIKGGNRDFVNSVIEKYFDKTIILTDEEDNNIYHIKINCLDRESDSTDFYIDDENNIELLYLSRCGNMSGTEILNKIINIGRDTNANYISLSDASLLYPDSECEFDFSHFMILLTGKSWYNHYGFKSINHNKDYKNNYFMRKMSLRDYIEKANENKRLNMDIIIEKIINVDSININLETEIKDIIQIMNQKIKTDRNTCDEIKKIVKIIVDLSKNLLSYHPRLHLKLIS